MILMMRRTRYRLAGHWQAPAPLAGCLCLLSSANHSSPERAVVFTHIVLYSVAVRVE